MKMNEKYKDIYIICTMEIGLSFSTLYSRPDAFGICLPQRP